MTKEIFKNQVPLMNREELVDAGFSYISPINSDQPVLMWIPKTLYDSIPEGFEIVTKKGVTEKFDPKKHPNEWSEDKCLPYGIWRKYKK